MENFIVSLEFLGSLACLFALGHLIGHLLKLDKFYSNDTKDNNKIILRLPTPGAIMFPSSSE